LKELDGDTSFLKNKERLLEKAKYLIDNGYEITVADYDALAKKIYEVEKYNESKKSV